MTDTQWADTSEYQVPADDTYPYRWFAFRMCNGDGPDTRGAQNYAWSQTAADRGALDGFFAYTVFYWDSNWAQNLIDEIGPNPHPRLVAMIDVEGWNGYNTGDHSANLNAGAALLAAHLGSLDRVVGYGNASDLNELWPDKSGLAANHLIYANYDGDPGYPGAFAHQYTNAGPCAPFGTCDMNSADGYDSPALMTLLGIPAGASTAGLNVHPFTPATTSEDQDMYAIQLNDTDDSGVIIAPGVPPQSRGRSVFVAMCNGYGISARTLPQWQYDTIIREQWTDASLLAATVAATVEKSTNPTGTPVDVSALAAAVVAAMPKTFTVTPAAPNV